jgi:hypothetical protein
MTEPYQRRLPDYSEHIERLEVQPTPPEPVLLIQA